ncbi:sulfur oxidation c-type cytochrome SoxA [Noviherbaspirillum sp. CPCC 100848]|uniref:SoxAX cytochrome complex subunit A n=1 Tax=Noviherbaspirillum album TaxID=3080276 RepID=A0ABU6J957_9BURK|nr:sulfur oxidation c-type cytochrome SoxA [Noviherbaspirillum sp. CPCC 100848]MEC4719973.1 sulfur oxidation c-type cytochrome SoxA [Noviherbaspirillum sp. CPCC 100848]
MRRASLTLTLIGLVCFPAAHAQQSADARLPGSAFMSRSTQEMQRDDSQNPAMLWVQEGEALWNRNAGRADRSCASCHGDATTSMRGVAARHPALDAASRKPLNLGQRINQCRQQRQQAEAFPPESEALLSLESYVALQSRGIPTAPPRDAALQPHVEQGRQHWLRRIGQLNLSCAQCHDDNWGKRLGSSPIPQAHPGGYPIYRLEWQAMGSLQRRLRNCMTGVRAQPYAFGAQELVELELYLAERARGMPLEAPGVRP